MTKTTDRISLNNPPACIGCAGELPPLTGSTTFYYRKAKGSEASVRVCGQTCALGVDGVKDYQDAPHGEGCAVCNTQKGGK